jgi:hypothetical protein
MTFTNVPFTRVPNSAKRRRKSQKLLENSGSETRQAMADLTRARSCPDTSMAPVLWIGRLVATASTEADTTRGRECFWNRGQAVSLLQSRTGWANRATAKTGQKQRLTRKRRKELGRRIWSDHPGLEVVHRDPAGMDIGSQEHYGAVGPDRDGEPVRTFGYFTEDLHRLGGWLTECRVRREGAKTENAKRGLPTGHCVSLGGYDIARQRQLLRGTVPPPAHPTGSPPSDYRQGGQTGATGVPHAQVRTRIRRPRRRSLCSQAPRAASPPSSKESGSTRLLTRFHSSFHFRTTP